MSLLMVSIANRALMARGTEKMTTQIIRLVARGRFEDLLHIDGCREEK